LNATPLSRTVIHSATQELQTSDWIAGSRVKGMAVKQDDLPLLWECKQMLTFEDSYIIPS